MAKYIQIRKYKTQKENHFYKVFTEDFESEPSYLSVNEKTHLITIYRTEHDEKPIVEFDLYSSENLSKHNINKRLIFPALRQIAKAIQKNQFLDRLDYCA